MLLRLITLTPLARLSMDVTIMTMTIALPMIILRLIDYCMIHTSIMILLSNLTSCEDTNISLILLLMSNRDINFAYALLLPSTNTTATIATHHYP